MYLDELLDELLNVHSKLAMRDNMSSVVIANMAAVEKDFTSSIAAGLMTLGGLHAPLEKAFAILGEDLVDTYLKHGILISGWGSAFHKGSPDPLFDTLDKMLFNNDMDTWIKIENITKVLHDKGKKLYPNAACYTAAVCMATDYPIQAAGSLLIKGRLDTWTKIFLEHYNPRLP